MRIPPGIHIGGTYGTEISMRWGGETHTRTGTVAIRAKSRPYGGHLSPLYPGGVNIHIYQPVEVSDLALTHTGMEDNVHSHNMLGLFGSGLPNEYLEHLRIGRRLQSIPQPFEITVNGLKYKMNFIVEGPSYSLNVGDQGSRLIASGFDMIEF